MEAIASSRATSASEAAVASYTTARARTWEGSDSVIGLPSTPAAYSKASRNSVSRPDRGFLALPKVAPTARFSMFEGRTIQEEIHQIHDNALFSFLKVITDMQRHNVEGELLSYCQDPEIVKRFGEGHVFKMGFGLHSGWAIEGAIGSKYKVDASYLSPNVNLASRLEAATKQFGVELLMSEQFVTNLSMSVRHCCYCLAAYVAVLR